MTTLTGAIKKLVGKLNNPIEYALPIGEELLPLNTLLGKKISLEFLEEIHCIQCGRKTMKSFQQGFCYPCYRKLMECNLCIIHPEKCNPSDTPCPDTWQHAHCKQQHIVYLANSSHLKIGITRKTQIPTRWIDQGASQAITLFEVGNRYLSGIIEVLFKQHIADKTHWRKMLTAEAARVDMLAAKNALLAQAEEKLQALCSEETEIKCLNESCVNLAYPVLRLPNKLAALTFDKMYQITGQLLGIKGQYLILDSGVLNIRKHSGYQVAITI